MRCLVVPVCSYAIFKRYEELTRDSLMTVIDFFQLSETNQEQVYYLQHIDHIIKSSITIARISDP